jgi:hypothetical protein
LENEYGSFNLKALKFLMHFWEPSSSLYLFLYHTYSYIFFFSHFLYSYFCSFFIFLIFFFFLSHQNLFYLLPLNSKIV